MWYLDNQVLNENWVYLNGIFSKEECNQIISQGNANTLKNAYVGDNMQVNSDIRKSKVAFFNSADPSTQWIYQKCTDCVNNINKQFFNFDLHCIETLQFTCYIDSGDKYDYHIDTMYKSFGARKLSFSILLNDPSEFDGGDIEFLFGSNPVSGHRSQGGANIFPSHLLHRVTPITKGSRYSLVGWVVGPKFK